MLPNPKSWFANFAKSNKARLKPTAAQRQTQPAPSFAVDRALLDHHVIRALDALGNRFESSAQGRSVVTATFTRNAGELTQLTITRELPDKLRIEQTSLTGQRALGHDGTRSWVSDGSPSPEDLRLVETMVRDSVEHLIAGQARGDATFLLGDLFRTDDGSNANYIGSFFDILRVDDIFVTAKGSESRPTLLYFNSRTGLPEKIMYERKGDATIKVEVEFGGWIVAADQKIPGQIVWKENGRVTQQLTITQVVFAPIVEDGIFTGNLGR